MIKMSRWWFSIARPRQVFGSEEKVKRDSQWKVDQFNYNFELQYDEDEDEYYGFALANVKISNWIAITASAC